MIPSASMTKILLIGCKMCFKVLQILSQDYKKTQKITWLTDVEVAADANEGALIPAVCVQFDHIITKGVLDKDEDFKSYVNTASKVRNFLSLCLELNLLGLGLFVSA